MAGLTASKDKATRRKRARTGDVPVHGNPVDRYVGSQLRRRRTAIGLSQERLAAEVGLTFQQIQKYERGINRISASRLFQFSRVLAVPISYFFDGYADAHDSDFGVLTESELLHTRESADLIRLCNRMSDPFRRRLLALTRAMIEET